MLPVRDVNCREDAGFSGSEHRRSQATSSHRSAPSFLMIGSRDAGGSVLFGICVSPVFTRLRNPGYHLPEIHGQEFFRGIPADACRRVCTTQFPPWMMIAQVTVSARIRKLLLALPEAFPSSAPRAV